jgi:hypothetical protein
VSNINTQHSFVVAFVLFYNHDGVHFKRFSEFVQHSKAYQPRRVASSWEETVRDAHQQLQGERSADIANHLFEQQQALSQIKRPSSDPLQTATQLSTRVQSHQKHLRPRGRFVKDSSVSTTAAQLS